MDSKTFRTAAHRAVEYIADYYDNVAEGPVRSHVEPGYLLSQVPASAPESTEDWNAIETDLHEIIEPGLCHWTHPNFMAYFPASSTFEGILGELYSAAFNNPAFDWICSPAITELELAMAGWLAEMLDLPRNFRASGERPGCGVIMSSTTECLITTMCSARDKALGEARSCMMFDGDDNDLRNRLVVLSSSETHVSTKKAADVVGVRHHSIPCDPHSGVAMTGAQLQDAVDQCLSQGLVPFYATVTFGTTNSCAIDDFSGIAKVKQRHPEIWVHVDAAYAGAALACEEFRGLAAGIEQFDSFSINLGKWLLTNLDCTMLFARQQSHILNSMQNTCAIVDNDVSHSRTVTDYRNLQLSMGRRFRSLKVWFVLRSWGKARIRAHIRTHVGMASSVSSWIRQRSDLFSFVTQPQFALNVIRVSDLAASTLGVDPNAATLKLYNAVSANRQLWVSKTAINGCTSIRIIAANTKSNLESLRFVFETLAKTLEDLIVETPRRPEAVFDIRSGQSGMQHDDVHSWKPTLLTV